MKELSPENKRKAKEFSKRYGWVIRGMLGITQSQSIYVEYTVSDGMVRTYRKVNSTKIP